jgi:hypothetical protein
MEGDPEDIIRIKCFNDQRKLRYRVITPGYSHDAAVTLTKNLRNFNREVLIPRKGLYLREGTQGYYYQLSMPLLDFLTPLDRPTDPDLEMPTDYDRQVCWTCKLKRAELKIFAPCGHRFSCTICSDKWETCPICNTPIEKKIGNMMLRPPW